MKNKTYKIYKCTNNVNGKIYIGYTHKTLEKRIIEHKCSVNTGSNYLLHKAMRKYGFENFSWELIFESFDKDYALNQLENDFILEYNSYFENGNGYNMTFGGQGGMSGKKHSEETKQKMRIARKNSLSQVRNPSGIGLEKAIKKSAESKKGKPSWNRGVSMQKSAKEKLSSLYKGRKWIINTTTNKRMWI